MKATQEPSVLFFAISVGLKLFQNKKFKKINV